MNADDSVTQLLLMPGELIDEEIAAMEKAMREGGASPSRLSGITASNKELRDRLHINIIESLLSFIHSVGKAFFILEEKKGNALPGVSYALTAQKKFLPDAANALVDPERTKPLCPLLRPDVFLPHAYEWYVRGVTTLPRRFRSKEWELCVNEAHDLVIRLTGEREDVEKTPEEKRDKASASRSRFGKRQRGGKQKK